MNTVIATGLNYLFLVLNVLIALGFLLQNKTAALLNLTGTALFFLAVIFLERFTPFRLTNATRYMLILTLTSDNLFGNYFKLYYTTGYFDNVLHTVGSFSFALLGYELLRSFLSIQSSHLRMLTFVIVFTIGITLGTFYELMEFAADQLFNAHSQFGLVDTNLDLLFNTSGAGLGGLYCSLSAKYLP